MSQDERSVPRRFPLRLEQTQPRPRRLVSSAVAPPVPASMAAVPVVSVARSTLPSPPASRAPATAASAREPVPRTVFDPGPFEQAAARLRMVDHVAREPGLDMRVLQAMAVVPRHRFVEPGWLAQAYEDTALPIGAGQTISKPSVVARMLSLALQRSGTGPVLRALEIGTGCGYQAAVMTLLARMVISVERLQPLYELARCNLADLRPDHLRLVLGDGRLGHAPNGPYDLIVSAAGGETVPAAWLDQLAPGGRLVAPTDGGDGDGTQLLRVVDRLPDGRLVQVDLEPVRFVPLESGVFKGGSS